MWLKTINDVAEQLYHLIGDYDVAYMVAELYVKKRVHQATEEAREFHVSNYWRVRAPPTIYSYNDSKLFRSTLRYLASPQGVRCAQTWIVSASAWGVKNLNKDNPTLRDKLDDMNYIPKKILTGSVLRYWLIQ